MIRLLRGANVLSLYIVMYSIITKLLAESVSHPPSPHILHSTLLGTNRRQGIRHDAYSTSYDFESL